MVIPDPSELRDGPVQQRGLVTASAGAALELPPMTKAEAAALRRRLREREQRRIRPGFYVGTDPHDLV